jgi:hypothetical protein
VFGIAAAADPTAAGGTEEGGSTGSGTETEEPAADDESTTAQAQRAQEDGLAIVCELDMNRAYDTEMHLGGDPVLGSGQCAVEQDETAGATGTGGHKAKDKDKKEEDAEAENTETDDAETENTEPERSGVVHITSDGKSTQDYTHSIVNVRDRNLSIDEVSEDTRVAFDYYEGPKNERAAPDEVFLVVAKRTQEQGSFDRTGTYVAVQTFNDGLDPDPSSVSCENDNKGWRTQNVSAEMRSEEGGWSDLRIGQPFPEDLMRGEAQAVVETARQLRDEGTGFESVVERYGEEAQLLAVGIGHGFTTQQTVLDVYYDDLVITGESMEDGDTVLDTREYDFPLAIPMEVDTRPNRLNRNSRGQVTMVLDFEQEEEGVSLDDVLPDTVELNTFDPIAPPLEEGVSARNVQVTGRGIRAQFPVPDVIELLDNEEMTAEEENQVIVSGEFENDSVVQFFGVDTVTVAEERNQGLFGFLDGISSFMPF